MSGSFSDSTHIETLPVEVRDRVRELRRGHVEHVITDSWITDGCTKARALLDAGYPDHAAEVLRYVEVKAMGLTKRQRSYRHETRVRQRPCSVRDCTRQSHVFGRRTCIAHAVRFDLKPAHVTALLTAMWCAAMQRPTRRMRRAA